MNEEERQAIEYFKDKEISFKCNFDTNKLLKILGITDEDNFENQVIKIKTLIKLIDKQDKLINKMKKFILDKTLMCEFLDMTKEEKTNENI